MDSRCLKNIDLFSYKGKKFSKSYGYVRYHLVKNGVLSVKFCSSLWRATQAGLCYVKGRRKKIQDVHNIKFCQERNRIPKLKETI